MRIYEQGPLMVVSLAPGTPVLDALTELASQRRWSAAAVWGIGALYDIVLGYYHLHEKRYQRIELSGEWELVACHGTLSTKEDQPFLHIHVVVSNARAETRGGHLFAGKVSAAGEFVVMPLPTPMVRQADAPTGLFLL